MHVDSLGQDGAETTSGKLVTPESYRLSPEHLDSMEHELVTHIKDEYGLDTGVVALVVDGDNKFADFGRTSETVAFSHEDYDFYEGMHDYEKNSLFIFTVDLDIGKVAHDKRVVTPKTNIEREETGLTGIEVFDDRLKAAKPGEQTTLKSILEFHGIEDINKCLNITTNFNTKRAGDPTREKPYSLMSYKAIFELMKALDITHFIAYLNPLAIKSLAKLGFEYDLLAGKEYHLPIPGTDTYDTDYLAVCIPAAPNIEAFTTGKPGKPLSAWIASYHLPFILETNSQNQSKL